MLGTAERELKEELKLQANATTYHREQRYKFVEHVRRVQYGGEIPTQCEGFILDVPAPPKPGVGWRVETRREIIERGQREGWKPVFVGSPGTDRPVAGE